MVLGYELRASQRATMLRVLRANTMLVRGHRSFSHDEFRRVVYAKYIRTPDQHVLLHTLMVSKRCSYRSVLLLHESRECRLHMRYKKIVFQVLKHA
jgi:hypothetical protein